MRSSIRELFETIILSLVIFLALHFVVGNYKVEGASMVPTLYQGEYVLVNKLGYRRLDASFLKYLGFENVDDIQVFEAPKRGEVIIFEFPEDPGRDFVKRVIGVPQDTVEIRKGQVYVNEQQVIEPYLISRGYGNHGKITVPTGSYFVMGDNRRVSNDSRDWGTVPISNVIGKAWVSFWPLDRWKKIGVPQEWSWIR